MSEDLIAFVRARLDEREAEARETADLDSDFWAGVRGDGTFFAMHDPAWVLRDVEAKRKIVDAYERAPDWSGREDVRWIAAIDADHPDYKQEWAG